MQLDGFVQALSEDLAHVAAVGDEATARTAEALVTALEPAIGRRLQEALSEAALELSAQLREGRVELRVAGRDPELVFVDEAPAGAVEAEEAYVARVTLRLPERLKSRLEAASAAAGVSVNTWLVQTLARTLEPRSSVMSGPHRLVGYGRN
jgi:hypothetical protein